LSKPYEWQHYDWTEALRLSRIASTPSLQEYPRHSARDSARDALHAQSQYVLENAFRYTNLLVPSPFGLPGACLVDMLHVILEGLMKYLAISFFARLTPSVKKEVDIIMVQMMRSNSQSECSCGNIPRTNFTHGISNCTRLTAGEWHGLILSCVALLQTDRGRKLLHEPLERSKIKIQEQMRYMKECQDAGHSSNQTNHSTTAPKGNAHHTIHKKRARSTKFPSEDETGAPDEHFYIPEDGGMSMSGVLSRGTDLEEAVFVGQQKNGWTAASDDKKIKVDTHWDDLSTDSVINQYLSVFELMLTFEAWTKKKDGYWRSSTRNERNDHRKSSSFMDPNQFPKPMGQVHAEGAIRHLIEFLHVSQIPRLSLKGELMKNQWNLPKLHWIQHYPQNIANNGGLRHHDCEIGEKGHQWHGKSIAHTAQKRISEFPHQCALRKMDQIKITCARIKAGDILHSKNTTTIPISPNLCYCKWCH
jgi:hypothetical protein